MAHIGKYYPKAFRRDLCVQFEELGCYWPKYYVWIEDTWIINHQFPAARANTVSSLVQWNYAGEMWWDFEFDDLLGHPLNCRVTFRCVEPNGAAEVRVKFTDPNDPAPFCKWTWGPQPTPLLVHLSGTQQFVDLRNFLSEWLIEGMTITVTTFDSTRIVLRAASWEELAAAGVIHVPGDRSDH